jgi:hypothetical protein
MPFSCSKNDELKIRKKCIPVFILVGKEGAQRALFLLPADTSIHLVKCLEFCGPPMWFASSSFQGMGGFLEKL